MARLSTSLTESVALLEARRQTALLERLVEEQQWTNRLLSQLVTQK